MDENVTDLDEMYNIFRSICIHRLPLMEFVTFSIEGKLIELKADYSIPCIYCGKLHTEGKN